MQSLNESQKQSWLSWFYRGLLLLGFLFIFARLFDLQIIRGAYFRDLAEGNRIRRVPIIAARGKILARGGEILVDNKEVEKRVTFNPAEGYEKTTDVKGAAEDELIKEYTRFYPMGEKLGHVSGYVGQVDENEVGKVNPVCSDKGPRKSGSLIGRGGLEEYYECRLSGYDGEELVEVDASGARVRTLGRLDAKSGADLRTTIHFGLQNFIADIFAGKKDFERYQYVPEGELVGAAVVTDTKGEVLALYSSPSYDPNIFIEGDKDKINDVFNDKRLPLFDRVISGTYHPGSVFKPVIALSALEKGVIDKDFTYDDNGYIEIKSQYGNYRYNNWLYTKNGGTEGEIGVSRALTRSTDTFFYKVGEMTGMDSLVEEVEKFNYGIPTGIDIPGEVSGLIPNPEWKFLSQGERWFLGNTYHFSIGQSDTIVTPIQVNQAISAIANGGVYCKPHLVMGDDDEYCRDLGLDKENLDIVIDGMTGACSEGGTGWTFFNSNSKVACKTGTAELGSDGKTHAWFTFFAPVGDDNATPDIVVTVLIPEGGEGSNVAGPIARAIFDYWFGNRE